MHTVNVKIYFRRLRQTAIGSLLFVALLSCGNHSAGNKGAELLKKIDAVIEGKTPDAYTPVNALLLIPKNPQPGEPFRLLATGGSNIRKARIVLQTPAGEINPTMSETGEELPCWRLDHFGAANAGAYQATLMIDGNKSAQLSFVIGEGKPTSAPGAIWKTTRSWDEATETLYSAWVNALFRGSDEQSSWKALHEVTQQQQKNLLYNYLSLDEDNPGAKVRVLMEPDCADNPFFLRAYFAWKLGLPFGYHISDRGYLGKAPSTGQWVTNESGSSKNHPVLAFNAYIRNIMNGVHSGTARTAFDNNSSDYYPVALDRPSLRPGTVFADPYGHTLIVVSWVPQTHDKPGKLLAIDAQPDKTVAVKRFWKGNFLFSTEEVVGEPGFKAFRPIVLEEGKIRLLKNDELSQSSPFTPYSSQQHHMPSEDFYQAMERVVNPKPLDPEVALLDLIQSLHEQLLVRVKSVANGEEYMQQHPGTVIPMPGSAKGVFQTGGLWEDFSTPNRDLRLLIAIDAVMGFPDRVVRYPNDYDIPKLSSPEGMKQQLQSLLNEKVAGLKISYPRSDGSLQELTVAGILARRAAFEMGYNPNDGAEIRWGAPEGSTERASCKRRAPAGQQQIMQNVRKWFVQRLHPPT